MQQRVAGAVSSSSCASCLAVLNTVKEALDLHELLATGSDILGHRLFHLSTNLRPKDRQAILAQIRACETNCILVATQVVEAGVDLSFDFVFRALAPLDAVVQAAGRCNRHGTGRRGTVYVVDVAGNSGTVIYGQVHMGLAREMLKRVTHAAGSTVVAEPQLRAFVQRYFKELDSRISHDRASKIFQAVRMLEFAALRGEGHDRDREAKRVQLIHEQFGAFPISSRRTIPTRTYWAELKTALAIRDPRVRRKRLRSLRNQVGQRVVEVPARDSLECEPDAKTGFVHVPLSVSTQHYSVQNGLEAPLMTLIKPPTEMQEPTGQIARYALPVRPPLCAIVRVAEAFPPWRRPPFMLLLGARSRFSFPATFRTEYADTQHRHAYYLPQPTNDVTLGGIIVVSPYCRFSEEELATFHVVKAIRWNGPSTTSRLEADSSRRLSWKIELHVDG